MKGTYRIDDKNNGLFLSLNRTRWMPFASPRNLHQGRPPHYSLDILETRGYANTVFTHKLFCVRGNTRNTDDRRCKCDPFHLVHVGDKRICIRFTQELIIYFFVDEVTNRVDNDDSWVGKSNHSLEREGSSDVIVIIISIYCFYVNVESI